ncbi:MAG: hypothetical protein AB7E85_08805 [Pseudobdellovibrionaceae bacterium]
MVTEDVTSVDARIGFTGDDEDDGQDENIRARILIDHAFNEWYAARIVTFLDKRKDNSFEYQGTTFENRFQLLSAEDSGFDLGARVGFVTTDGDKKPYSLTYGLYQQIPLDTLTIRFNQLFSNDVGEDAANGTEFEFRAQAIYHMNDDWGLGLESFNDFGNLSDHLDWSEQSHSFGPVTKLKLNADTSMEMKYRTGLSDAAPDHTVGIFWKHNF